jgi:hypothetical protein
VEDQIHQLEARVKELQQVHPTQDDIVPIENSGDIALALRNTDPNWEVSQSTRDSFTLSEATRVKLSPADYQFSGQDDQPLD